MRLLTTLFFLLLPFAASAELSIEVSPTERLWMEDPSIVVDGAEPGAAVSLVVTLTDDADQFWASRGEYFADSTGQVDVSRDAAVAGTYRGTDPHGPFWSLLPVDPRDVLTMSAEEIDPLAPRTPRLQPIGLSEVKVTAHSGGTTVSAQQKVGFSNDDIVVEEVDEQGLRGKFLSPGTNGPHPAILVVTGSGGGANVRSAALLASKGFSVFALAHFNYPGRPSALQEIPLEYFSTAIEWLREKANVDKIGLAGLSRGGEGALLIASTFPEHIGAVVAGVPSNVIWGGCCNNEAVKAPAWLLGGEALGASPYPFEQGKEGFEYLADSIGFRDFYMPGMTSSGDNNTSTIRVENIAAPILLISGAADLMWPSSIAAERIEKRLKEKGFKYPVTNVIYPAAGHHVTSDVFVTIRSSEVVHPVTKTTMYLGGLPSANAADSRDAFHKKVAFFKSYVTGEK